MNATTTPPCHSRRCAGQRRTFRTREDAEWCEHCGERRADIQLATDPKLAEVLALAQELKEDGLSDDEAYAAALTFVSELDLEATAAGTLALPLARLDRARVVHGIQQGVVLERGADDRRFWLSWSELPGIVAALVAELRYHELATEPGQGTSLAA